MSEIDSQELDQVNQSEVLGLPKFTHTGGDPNRRQVLEENYRVREGIDPTPHNVGSSDGFGRVAMRIPEFDYPFICAMYPGLKSTNNEERHRTWQEFARSPLSEPYRLDRRKRIIKP
jgi:hypothetical protein